MGEPEAKHVIDGVRKGLMLEIVVVLGVLFFPSFLGQFLSLPAASPTGFQGMLYRLVTAGAHCLLILYIVYVARKFEPIPKPTFDYRTDFLLGIILVVASQCVWAMVSPLFAGTGSTTNPRPWETPTWYPYAMAVTVAVSAFYQELLMRWYLISRLEQFGTKTWEAVGISTLIFAGWHIYLGPGGATHALLAGLLYALCFVATRRLGPIVIAHFLWNFWVFYTRGHM